MKGLLKKKKMSLVKKKKKHPCFLSFFLSLSFVLSNQIGKNNKLIPPLIQRKRKKNGFVFFVPF